MRTGGNPEKRRPELLLIGGDDHVELGSAIRSVCAFGWRRCLVEDRFGVWFGSERWKRAEGRAASRASRNTTRLIPVRGDKQLSFREAVIINTEGRGVPLSRAKLANGPSQLIVIPDGSKVSASDIDSGSLAANVSFAHLDLPADDYVYHYRLTASIPLAEISRQLGRKDKRGPVRRGRAAPIYDKTLAATGAEHGVDVCLQDLQDY